MANKVKKVLIIGDSNCLPRIISKKISVNLEDTYIFKLKKNLKVIRWNRLCGGGLQQLSYQTLLFHTIKNGNQIL